MLPWTFILSSTQISTCDFSIKRSIACLGIILLTLRDLKTKKSHFFYEVINIVSLTNLYMFQRQYGVCECEIIMWYVKDEMLAGIILHHPLLANHLSHKAQLVSSLNLVRLSHSSIHISLQHNSWQAPMQIHQNICPKEHKENLTL